MGDLWHWRVVYTDGSVLDEYDADGNEHGWAEVEVARVAEVLLVPQIDGLPAHQMHVTGAACPRFLRRRSITVSQSGGETRRSTLHMLGLEWEAQRGVYLFLAEDGRVLLTDDCQAV